ncbi:GntR family transcriptional regulator [Allokutzneria sp. A3M-2-11 16]|uniref:GntR family transcriptional regulator n=1 Tax=Allokutzneria sp. A3M-2-11 16 TaxID=2962043 RepID=UPI0020B6978D|nr:GntR family transcriptional regulator [Allokutzneria sp. A3M-2-11 16]MCP3798411.1 GntR family transcriptional regulator [Allokutzneria sp. A3M-2-11 16]
MIVNPLRQSSLGELLLDQLRALIVRGELAAGTHLVEGWIAERFEVSRGPVRDALRQLEIEGLVETRRRGVYVRGLSDTDLVELYSLRGALESLAIRETIARGDDADWTPLDEAVARMRSAAESASAAEFAAADLDFHSGFYVIGGNRWLTATWELHRPLFAAVLDITNTDRDLRPIAEDHAELAAVVRSGDVAAALSTLTTHLDGSCARIRTVLAERRGAP